MLTLAVSVSAFAQKSELANAKSEYDKFAVIRTGKLAATSLNTAKASIDKAAANDKTAQVPQTLALKAAIYSSLANDTTQASRDNLVTAAQDAYKKAQDAYAKGAYSYSMVGSEEAKKALREPVANTLYFAGEALYSGTSGGTVEAALVQGLEVAKKVLKK